MLTIAANNLNRYMQCNGHRLLQADPVFIERDNTIRDEGIAAHWLAAIVFSGQHTIDEMVDRKAPNGIFITSEMAEHVEEYVSGVQVPPNYSGDMEWPYSLTGQNWQVNGRADHVLFTGQTLAISDFKYGYTIVEPERNWTLIAHAIGYCQTNNVAPQRITFTIHQPRAPHRDGRVRSWSIDGAALHDLYSELVVKLVYPSDTLQTGPNCYKCPAFVGCPARQDAELNALETAHMAYRAEIDNAELADRMALIHRAEEMIKQAKKAYEEQIMHRLQLGQALNGYAIENDLTNRMWKDGVTVDLMQTLTGVNLSKPQLVTPAQAEKAGVSKDIVALFAERRAKGSKLVRVDTDKRAAKFFGERKPNQQQ